MCEETRKSIKGEITNHSQKQRVNTDILNDLNLIEKGSQIAFFQLSVSHSYIALTEKKTIEMLTKNYANFKIVSAFFKSLESVFFLAENGKRSHTGIGQEDKLVFSELS